MLESLKAAFGDKGVKAMSKMNPRELEVYIKTLENLFDKNDRALEEMEKERVKLVKQAMSVPAIRQQQYRAKYRVNRNKVARSMREYQKQIVLYTVANEALATIQSMGASPTSANQLAAQLAKKFKMGPDKLWAILEKHEVQEDFGFEEWEQVAKEINQKGLKSIKSASEADEDNEFDQLLKTAQEAKELENVDAVLEQKAAEIDAKKEKEME